PRGFPDEPADHAPALPATGRSAVATWYWFATRTGPSHRVAPAQASPPDRPYAASTSERTGLPHASRQPTPSAPALPRHARLACAPGQERCNEPFSITLTATSLFKSRTTRFF